MDGQPFAHYYIASTPGAGQGMPQQQQKDGLQPQSGGSAGNIAPLSYAVTPLSQAAAQPLSGGASGSAPPPPAPTHAAETRWVGGGNAQSGVMNAPPPPPQYAMPQGQVMYVHGGPSATSAGPQVLMGHPSMSMSIVPANTQMLYPTMSMSPTGPGNALAYFMPADAGPPPQQQPPSPPQQQPQHYSGMAVAAPGGHGFYLLQPAPQQQQQQHSALLNAAGSTPGAAGTAGATFPYLVLPSQQGEHTNMASLSSFPSFPSSTAHAVAMPPPMVAYLQRPAQNVTAPPYACPPPLHTFAAPVTTAHVRAGGEMLRHHRHHVHRGEASSSLSLTPLGVLTAAGKKAAAKANAAAAAGAGGAGSAKWRRGSHSVDSTPQNPSASVTSQSSVTAQGLPYAEDPVAIDTTKRQLIVNYLPQRLTDVRFRDLFRPYGELMEDESHIIYDFRHHKMVPVAVAAASAPPHITTEVPTSVGGALQQSGSHTRESSTTTASLSLDKDAPTSALAAAATTTSQSTMDVTTAGDGTALSSGVDNVPAGTMVAATRSMPRSKGYGFIYYKDGASTERAIMELNGKEVDGKRIKVRYAEQQRSFDALEGAASGAGEMKEAEVHLCDVATDSDSEEEEEEALFNMDAFKMEDE